VLIADIHRLIYRGWTRLSLMHFLSLPQTICSYLFMPLAFLAGVPWEDCSVVAELFGTKTFLNEFVAYVDMSNIVKGQVPGKTLKVGSDHAFGNMAALGVGRMRIAWVTITCDK